jgi:tryptophanyl-tRNA synthetase
LIYFSEAKFRPGTRLGAVPVYVRGPKPSSQDASPAVPIHRGERAQRTELILYQIAHHPRPQATFHNILPESKLQGSFASSALRPPVLRWSGEPRSVSERASGAIGTASEALGRISTTSRMTDPTKQRPRILSGMRPTGKLHLGNLVGALQNWVKLQDQYESFHFVADWHMLTTDYADTSELQQNILEMVTDWLAAGLDQNRATFFVQSRLPEHAELHLLFSMVTPLGWLERVPTYKEALENIKDRDIHTYGFLGYPVLQAADILMYKADAVPVGEDQVPHVELTREIARRFNNAFGEVGLEGEGEYPPEHSSWDGLATSVGLGALATGLYGSKDKIGAIKAAFRRAPLDLRAYYLNNGLGRIRGIFPEPEALLTPAPRLPGTDGRKMSKSYNNAVFLSDPPEVVSKKLATMITDPARKRRTDKGNPDVCPVFDLHKVFSTTQDLDRVNRECRAAEIGCLDCKAIVARNINECLKPIQERRKVYEQEPRKVWDILEDGTARARKVAQATMDEVRAAVKLT